MPGPSCMLAQKHMYNVINGPTEITALYKGCRPLMKYGCMCTVDQMYHNLINLLEFDIRTPNFGGQYNECPPILLASTSTVTTSAEVHLLVSSEDPDSNAGISQALNGLWHSRLQLVLDGGAAQQQQLSLYQVSNRCKLLLTPCQGCLGLKVLLLPPARMTTV
jgi:hypothetical protein